MKTETKTAHTPTPWSVDAMGYIRGPESENILENHENAEFVCSAVNAHEELVTALKAISDAYASDGNTRRQKEAFALVRQVLAKEEGK